ncbi:MAG: hypothetical protein WEB53_12095 [Akkermansiaceae bacterium]
MFESSAAARVVEKVRAAAPGVVVEIFVKPGETVQKDQILGHTELDATKLQLDLAKRLRDTKANVESSLNQAEAWTVTRVRPVQKSSGCSFRRRIFPPLSGQNSPA